MSHAARSPRSASTPARGAGARPSALIVTDDQALTRICTSALVHAGFDVVAASHSGHALLQYLRGWRGDLLVTELCMPDGSGPALAGRLRRYDPALRAIFIGNAGTLVHEANVLVRPFSRDDLLARIRASINAPTAS